MAEVSGGEKINLVVVWCLVELVTVLGKLEGELLGSLLGAGRVGARQEEVVFTVKYRGKLLRPCNCSQHSDQEASKNILKYCAIVFEVHLVPIEVVGPFL